jgi:glucuronoarabinoxylan endo-1,4-beta-xylanase
MIRYGITGSPPTNVTLSMFKDPATNNVAVVAVNNQGSTAALTITLDSTSKCQVATPWVTDPSNNVAQQAPVAISSHAFAYTLSASSVTTFTCNGT